MRRSTAVCRMTSKTKKRVKERPLLFNCVKTQVSSVGGSYELYEASVEPNNCSLGELARKVAMLSFFLVCDFILLTVDLRKQQLQFILCCCCFCAHRTKLYNTVILRTKTVHCARKLCDLVHGIYALCAKTMRFVHGNYTLRAETV